MTEPINLASHGLEEVSTVTNIRRLLQIYWIPLPPAYSSMSSHPCLFFLFPPPFTIYFPLLLPSLLFLFSSSCFDFLLIHFLVILTSQPVLPHLPCFFLWWVPPLSSSSLLLAQKKIHQKPVISKRQPAAELHKSSAPPMSGREKRTPLSAQSGGTAFSTAVATEVNYGWPSILHTLKWSAGTGHKTLSICYIHQSSL